MGLEDREYLRDEARRYGTGSGGGFGSGMRPSMSDNWAIRTIIIMNVVVWVLQLATADPKTPGAGGITEWLSLSLNDLASFQIWRLITYGFCHATGDLMHIAFNMLFLWMFGRMVEGIYGSREFMAFYLIGILISGFANLLVSGLLGRPDIPMIGASGGVNAVVILTAMHFPRLTVYFMLFLPMPLWVLAIFYVGMDALGLIGGGGNVAHAAHLGGAAFGFLYFRRGWRISPLLSSFENWKNPFTSMQRKRRDRKRQKELQVFEPHDDELRSEVDRILAKINEQGEASLTDDERKTLERASRIFRGR